MGEGEAEGGDFVGCLEGVGKGELVEDVGLDVLDDEEDAEWSFGFGFGGSVGFVCGCETEGERVDAGIGGKGAGVDKS